ncbi:hypothetical protein CCMSSC00406_0004847 [Pleurotus cornucopiae]|uniref:Uncharacterized protein n=1 Tax=Pleurotus cornucopiae TaxID=5321 RepID=A0ACB7IZU8_PLECO|nr:hypothetical protein CCMSSC00406_0004847 [Pleurotus cornucopiae]
MKLTLRPEWRLWPLSSFLGVLDIKTGVTIALLFALFNKVTGVYGLIAVVTGAGGSFAQLSLYIYSAIALGGLVWGLNAIKQEDAKNTLYFAHFFFIDHIFSTIWTVFFAVAWWIYTPHDGRRIANSEAQKKMMEGGPTNNMTDAERATAAMTIWTHEKGTAATVIIISWLVKIYFALLLYSYASHLRKGSYRSLSQTRSVSTPLASGYDSSLLPEGDEDDVEAFYRAPLRTPNTGNSISSFADFVGAPSRTHKHKGSSSLGRPNVAAKPSDGDEEEVLFDDEELMSSRSHSKFGTDESTASVSSQDDEHNISIPTGLSRNRP